MVVITSAAILPVVVIVILQQLQKANSLPLLRWSADDSTVVPRALKAPVRFHAFLSHNCEARHSNLTT